jgi:hypothetical protein
MSIKKSVFSYWFTKCTYDQCCGSGSGIRCLFDPRIRDPEWVFPDPGSQTHSFESLVTIFCVKSSIILWKLTQIFCLQHIKNKIIYYFVKFVTTLQRQFRLYIPFLGIARPQPQFPHSCVFERFIYSQDQSTHFLQQNSQTHHGNI